MKTEMNKTVESNERTIPDMNNHEHTKYLDIKIDQESLDIGSDLASIPFDICKIFKDAFGGLEPVDDETKNSGELMALHRGIVASTVAALKAMGYILIKSR